MKMITASTEKIRATAWYEDCSRYSAAYNWPFGHGAVLAVLLLIALLAISVGAAVV
ncbi:MAG: hypothetical protein QY323_04605 [Patescibacteria group bacterium]|nr:MAG: hypothetical protein QY323_04605 [Patescibacteria group bacterium]